MYDRYSGRPFLAENRMTWRHWNVIFSKIFQLNLTKVSDKVSNWCPIRYWEFGGDILRSSQVIANIREGGRICPPAGRGLTRALLGGGAFERPPWGFSRISKIRRRAAPPGFHPPYPPSFPQLLWKFRPKAMWGQVTRSGQVTKLQNNFPIAPRPQCFRESYETFGIWWGHQCQQNVYLGFLISVTSGQVIFATSPL